MNYEEALEYLKKVQQEGVKLTIENIQKIIDHLPFSLKKIKYIQVAGTNGKGSTSHFIVSILQQAGFKVGLFVSPHLQDIRERISIDKKWISQKDFSHSLAMVHQWVEGLYQKKIIASIPTFFEHLFLIALHHFWTHNTAYAVLEVGMGGRLDATSTITPQVAVITNISYDHTQILGRRISDIALEKAGIIKPGAPIVCGCLPNSKAGRIIKGVADQRKSPIFFAFQTKNNLPMSNNEPDTFYKYSSGVDDYFFQLGLKGDHQVINAAVAIKTIEQLLDFNATITKENIQRGVKNNFVPGRIEMIKSCPPVILDGGHNIAGIKVLTDYLAKEKITHLTLIFGVLKDKKYRQMIRMLLPFVDKVILTEPLSHRQLPAEKLTDYFKGKSITIEKNIRKAYNKAQSLSNRILITGSLYLAGEMRNIIMGGKHD